MIFKGEARMSKFTVLEVIGTHLKDTSINILNFLGIFPLATLAELQMTHRRLLSSLKYNAKLAAEHLDAVSGTAGLRFTAKLCTNVITETKE